MRAFLPDGLTLDGEPRLEVCLMSFSKIGWLAGRGYDILMVRIPSRWIEGDTQCVGHFVPVVWENMADPIITGREELGWPKIFADISVSDPSERSAQAAASWDGHRFFDFSAAEFTPVGQAPSAMPMVFEKYIPATGEPGSSDAHYLTVTGSDGPEPQVQSVEVGRGRFGFNSATWEQMPTQYPIATALADLPLSRFSRVTKTASTLGGDGSGQQRLRLSA